METSGLTERQKLILRAIIQDFVDNAEPIGSEVLVEKHHLDFSAATTRNEMAEMTRKGFLEKSHSSAGRFPTTHGFRFFVKNMMVETELPVVNEVAIKQRLWNNRHDLGLMLRESVSALASQLQDLSFVLTDDRRIYIAGSVHILRHPEFYDIDLTRTVLHLLDQYDLIESILSQIDPEQDFGLLLGEETGMPSLASCGIVSGRVDLPGGRQGYIGVIGPYRLDYPKVIPALRYVQQIINELSRSY